MAKKVTGREAHYDDRIFALGTAGTASEAVKSLRVGLEEDYRAKISRQSAPTKGEMVPVREYYDGSPNPTDWFEVEVT